MTGSPPLIAHVIHRLDFGGLENGLVNLVNRIRAERYRHAIVCLCGFNPEFRARIERDDVEVIPLGKRPGKDLGAYVRMWRVLRRLKPAIIHTRNLGTVDMQWVAAAAGVPHRVHGEHGWEATDPQGLDASNLRIRRACRPVVHRYVCMSQDIARWLEREVRVNPSRIRQLYSGVDVEKFAPASGSDHGDAANEPGRGTGGNVVTIGTVGRLDAVKNHALLLRAFATLRRRVPSLHLVIVGDGPLRSALEAQAAAEGLHEFVHFTGTRNDTPGLMRRFDVFALPSVNEGVSNTILEAMATGLPVVASRVGGNPEIVVDGVTGSLYDPGDDTALVRALLPYVTGRDLRREHGARGRERVVRLFSLEAMVQRYLAMYDELITCAA